VRSAFDRRVVSTSVLEVVAACQERVPCHVAGGVALSAAYLGHRKTGDLDLFCHQEQELEDLRRVLPEVARRRGGQFDVLRDAGHLVRARLTTTDARVEVDMVHEPSADLEPPPPPLEGVVVESLTDLRASKLTCLLSRSEPRDLVDVLFLERLGHRPEADLALALRKDRGIDPGVLAWLLSQFPCEPLPEMLVPLSAEELLAYRDSLAERLRRLVVGQV
jgi:hypothetical protein